ncbi:AGAP009718-PA [Anopheles gambiae str. PEST]|uniref:AGAP009718-PA n=1 Tax=Anopheles gambiae TaxID=7165 RepID=Q7PK61_ANOGA|nr:AGAP009718-PA [Anopheles gambiae str. PEST]
MANVEGFRKLMKSLIVYSKVAGVEIWTAPGKFVPASYYVSFHITVYFVSTVWTLRKYIDDPIHMMKVLITMGTAVQLYIKFFVGHSKAQEIMLVTAELEQQVLKRYQNGSEQEIAVLRRTGRILWIVYRMMSASYIFAAVAFGLYPAFYYFATGVVVPLFLYELPFFDLSSSLGYAVTMCFQINLLAIGVLGAILSDFVFFMYAMYAMARADISIVHLRELENILNNPSKNEEHSAELRHKWVQCMHDHQQSTSFFSTIENIFGLMCLAQVATATLSICDAMLLVLLTDWYPTYSYLYVMFVQLSGFFVIGHLVELKIDAMYNKIISMPWYKLPLKEQKEFRFLMSRQQCPMILTAYGFHPMNFEAYMSVLKVLYQFFVMIMQYIDRN